MAWWNVYSLSLVGSNGKIVTLRHFVQQAHYFSIPILSSSVQPVLFWFVFILYFEFSIQTCGATLWCLRASVTLETSALTSNKPAVFPDNELTLETSASVQLTYSSVKHNKFLRCWRPFGKLHVINDHTVIVNTKRKLKINPTLRSELFSPYTTNTKASQTSDETTITDHKVIT